MKSKNFIHFRPKKYGNVSCFVDGIRFDSRREADYYSQLKIEKRAKLIRGFERQVNFDLYAWRPHSSTECGLGSNFIDRVMVCAHRVDFLVTLPNLTKEVREVKGMATSIWDLKYKLFCANYPDIPYKVIK